MIRLAAEGIWTLEAPQSLFGLQVGSRMTVVDVGEGLMIHSPVALSEAVAAQIEEIGEVRHIVCPNLFHHMHAADACRRWPRALLYGPPGLSRKRPDLPPMVSLHERGEARWGPRLRAHHIGGTWLDETVFFDDGTGTLITSDLVENFQRCSHLPTRAYLHATGLWKNVTWGRHLRVLYRDRDRARRDVDRLLRLPITSVVLAHGDCLEVDAHEQLARGLSWL